VRDRLYPTEQTASVPQARALLKNFVRGSQIDNGDCAESSAASIRNGSPIAELYPDTTVLFADIAGFTAWSSSRSPTQVFQLLETLYAGFDAIARQRGVFKVETIGDCYVAVVGLPVPKKHHAIVMARFAHDCQQEMKRLTTELEKELGLVRCF
jgi:class 3 adenylate cyclase